jgi:16S rRNA G966 N2-methylase RsmD
MDNVMTMRPFFTYYGGKWRIAPAYPLPRHATIIEPFAGSAGYALRYPDRKVLLIDADENIVSTWRFLISATADEIRRLPDIKESIEEVSRLSQESRTLIGWWLNHGTTAPCKTPSRWMRDGKHSASFWGPEVRERIARQVDRIRHWSVLHGSYHDAPDIAATWFVDPPYQVAGKHYRKSQIDYANLADWCLSRQGQTIVCENVGADWLPFVPFLSAKANESANGGKVSHEAIWLSDGVITNRRPRGCGTATAQRQTAFCWGEGDERVPSEPDSDLASGERGAASESRGG